MPRKIKDKRFLRTVYAVIESCGGGLAIGYYICQWLANYYLETLDHFICAMPGVKTMTRYMDNITLFGPNKKKLHKARQAISDFLRDRLGLKLKSNWQIYPTAKRMVSAVGYRFAQTHTILAQAELPALHPSMPACEKETGRRKAHPTPAGIRPVVQGGTAQALRQSQHQGQIRRSNRREASKGGSTK